jgi:hypothetical protein
MDQATPQRPSLLATIIEQGKRIARAEVQFAREDLKEDVRGAARSTLLLGTSAWLGLTGMSALVIAAALARPARPVRGALYTGLTLLGGSLAVGLAGLRALPREPLSRSRQGLQEVVAAVSEERPR